MLRMRVTVTIVGVMAVLVPSSGRAFGQTGGVTIERARQLLDTNSSGKMLGNIDLTAVDYFREIGLGHGIRAIVVSTNMGGGIALFSSKGVMEDTLATGQPESIRLFDLNGDGMSEILTDESDGPATGILIMHYNLYAVNSGKINRVWHGLSYKRDAPEQADKVRETQDFVRFDEAGAGYPARMTYLVSTGIPGRYRRIEYVMTGLVVHELSKSAAKK